jgi:hypothetical protein
MIIFHFIFYPLFGWFLISGIKDDEQVLFWWIIGLCGTISLSIIVRKFYLWNKAEKRKLRIV